MNKEIALHIRVDESNICKSKSDNVHGKKIPKEFRRHVCPGFIVTDFFTPGHGDRIERIFFN